MAEEKKTAAGQEEEIDEVDDTTDDGGKKTEGKKTEGKKTEGKEEEDKAGEKSFSQEQVNKLMAKEKNQGRNSVFKELGIDPKNTKLINMLKSVVDSQKTEEEKAAEKGSEATKEINEAKQRATIAEAKAEAMMFKAKPIYVDDLVALAIVKLGEDGDLKTIIGELKKKYPDWFSDEKQEDDKTKGKKTGTGSSVKASSKEKQGDDDKSLGARLAAQRKAQAPKDSYWGKKK